MNSRPPITAYAALAAVCVIWGTVYLAIRIALESFPPIMLMALRFLAAGIIILAVAKGLGATLPSRKEFLRTSLYGVLTLGVGIGTLFLAITWIPSGLAAVFSTTAPFWMVGVEALLPGGQRPNWKTVVGILIGLSGALVLAVPGAIQTNGSEKILASFLVIQLGCCGFALGSILERRHRVTTNLFVTGAVQELATGLVFVVPALFVPQSQVHWDAKGLGAILYLTVFGGILAYTAYLYAMKHLPVPLVSIYNYVNPIIAVLAGILLYGEKFERAEGLAGILILTGVVVVKHFSTSH